MLSYQSNTTVSSSMDICILICIDILITLHHCNRTVQCPFSFSYMIKVVLFLMIFQGGFLVIFLMIFQGGFLIIFLMIFQGGSRLLFLHCISHLQHLGPVAGRAGGDHLEQDSDEKDADGANDDKGAMIFAFFGKSSNRREILLSVTLTKRYDLIWVSGGGF